MSPKVVIETLSQRFTSGNSIPVERTHITREEWETLVLFLVQARTEPPLKAPRLKKFEVLLLVVLYLTGLINGYLLTLSQFPKM